MKTRKKRVLIICFIVFVVISIGALSIFRYYHPTHYKYNDRFVIGSDISQIIDRYGEFDHIFYTDETNKVITEAGYIVKPAVTGFLGTSWPVYYMISLENGKAVSVKLEEGSWGGLIRICHSCYAKIQCFQNRPLLSHSKQLS